MSDPIEREIAAAIAPLLAERITAARAEARVAASRDRAGKVRDAIVDAALGVADAVEEIERQRFTGGERPARMALERKAKILCGALKAAGVKRDGR